MMGMPEEHLEGMKQIPLWPMWEAIAPTFGYDAALLGEDGTVPTEHAAQVSVPTLVMDGELTPYPSMPITAQALAKAIPNAQHRILAGQDHAVSPQALTPVLIEVLTR